MERAIQYDHVSDANASFGFVGSETAVDEKFCDFRDFLPICFGGDMNWFSGGIHNSGDITGGCTDSDAASKQVTGIEAARRIDAQVSLVIDVTNEKSDLVHVCCQHDF